MCCIAKQCTRHHSMLHLITLVSDLSQIILKQIIYISLHHIFEDISLTAVMYVVCLVSRIHAPDMAHAFRHVLTELDVFLCFCTLDAVVVAIAWPVCQQAGEDLYSVQQ